MARLRDIVLARLERDKDAADGNGWNRHRLAQECVRRGVIKTPDPIYRWLSGQRDIMLETAEVVCDILKIPLGAPTPKKKRKKVR